MKELLKDAAEAGYNLMYVVPAFMGGLVDYINQWHRGDKVWSFMGFIVHMTSALFFGWISGLLVGEYAATPGMIAAGGGLGGFLGVRVADLIVSRFLKIDRRSEAR